MSTAAELSRIATAVDTLAERIERLERAHHQPPRTAWTAREVADQIGIPYKTVLEIIGRGELGYTAAGRHYVIPDAELQAYLARGHRCHRPGKNAAGPAATSPAA